METQVVDKQKRKEKKAQAEPDQITLLVQEWNASKVQSFDTTMNHAKVFMKARDLLVKGIGKTEDKKDLVVFLGKVHVNDSSAVKWEAIANCRYFSREPKDDTGKPNPYFKYAPLWPYGWTVLYEITGLTPEEVATGVQKGIIKPDMTRADVKSLVTAAKTKKFDDFLPDQAAKIYVDYISGLGTMAQLAARYGTLEPVISKIIEDQKDKAELAERQEENAKGAAAIDPVTGLPVSHVNQNPLGDPPAPAEPETASQPEAAAPAPAEVEPTETQILEALEQEADDYEGDDNNEVRTAELKSEYPSIVAAQLRIRCLKVMRDLGVHGYAIEAKKKAASA